MQPIAIAVYSLAVTCHSNLHMNRNVPFYVFFILLHMHFPHQVSYSLLLLLSEEGCRDFSAYPPCVNLKENQKVAHQPETSQQECDSQVWS